MSGATLVVIVVEAVAAATVGWALADLILRRIARDDEVGLPERALFALAAIVLFATGIMVLHSLTGGLVLGVPGVVPIIGAVVVFAGRSSFARLRALPVLPIGVASLVLLVLFAVPAFESGSGVRTGDSAWHMGWTAQLLAGEPLPVGPAPEFARNGYPWGFHAVLATLSRLVPGSDALIAHESLHLILLAALPLGAACLARRARAGSGWGAAGAFALVGGFGWLTARAPFFAATPDDARYGADMVVASPNAVYELFSPAFPRELGLALLAAGAVAVGIAIDRRSWTLGVLGGAALGSAGLVNVPMLVSGALWTLAAAAVAQRGFRARLFVTVAIPAALVFGLWAVPTAVDYARFGAFVDITPKLGRVWPVASALWSWGLLFPLALTGAIIVARRRQPTARLLIAFGVAALGLLVLALARKAVGWNLQGNETLLHSGRAWPPLHLIGSAFAGVAVTLLYRAVSHRSRTLAAAVVAAIFTVGMASLVLSSQGMTEKLIHGEDGFVYGREDYAPGSFLRTAARFLGPRDVLAVDETPDNRVLDDTLAFHVFEFSGVRLASYENRRLRTNDLRIRFADLAAAYEERMRTGGFEPDYVIKPDDGDPDALGRGSYGDVIWILVECTPRCRSRPRVGTL